MASPLRWFRRNQKVMLIGFGVLLMVVFLLPYLFDPGNFSASTGPPPETVLMFEGKPLTNYDLDEYRNRHLRAYNFLERLQQIAYEKQGPDLFNQAGYQMYDRIPVETMRPADVNRSIIRRKLVAKEAEKLGIVVSDSTVLNYVQHLTSGEFSSERQLDNIARQETNGQMTYASFKEQVKEDLLVHKTLLISQAGMQPLPNMARSWELYRKMNYRIDCTVLAVPASELLKDVESKPTPAEQRELFQEGQYKYVDPDNDKPGFKIRRKLGVQYFIARFDDFLQSEMTKIKPEEVEAEYKRLVEAESNIVVKPKDSTDDSLDTNMDDDQTGTGDSNEENEGGSENLNPDAPKPPGTDDSSKSDSADNADDDTDEHAGENEGGETNEEEGDEGNQQNDDGLSLSFVSLAYQQQEGEQEEGTEQDTNAENDIVQPPEDVQESTPTDTDENENENGEGSQEEEPVEFYPLEEVAEQIKMSLARVPAQNQMERAISMAVDEVYDYQADYDDYQSWLEDPENNEPTDEPKPLDLKKIADKYKLVSNSVPVMTDEKFNENEFGETLVTVKVPHPQFPSFELDRSFPIADVIYSRFDDMKLYQTEVFKSGAVTGSEPDKYIIWLNAKEPPRVPTFEEAQKEIVSYWQKQRASGLALEKAQRIAGDIGDGTLAERFEGTAQKTGYFSWFSSITLSYFPVSGTEFPGEEFMETAFSLKPGECGAALNRNKTVAYVIQLNSIENEDESELRQRFFAEYDVFMNNLRNPRFNNPLLNRHQRENQISRLEWFGDLEEKYDVKWITQ